ncbi:MAG: flagellar assembly protein H [Proteobacteria bacterium SG_bin9]|nr:MAG: flagellar assembly protein H [Proteobacteria bacterium SG_bin9]
MGITAKFLFDNDFSVPDAAKERAAASVELAQKVAEAEARAYRSGFDAAMQEARAESDRRQAMALEEIAMSLKVVAGGFAAVENKMETEAVDVAVAVARKLCSSLIAAEPLTEMMALVEDCFRHLVATPHLVVRINETLYDGARERIERLAKQSGFDGRLVILAQPDIPAGDCRIEWADGGVTLDRASIDAKIDELVARYMAPRNQSA